jgi:hypothetical protein
MSRHFHNGTVHTIMEMGLLLGVNDQNDHRKIETTAMTSVSGHLQGRKSGAVPEYNT